MGEHMKHLLISLLMMSFLTNLAFAEETSTECPMMAEQTVRNNPKENLDSKPKPRKARGSQASAQ